MAAFRCRAVGRSLPLLTAIPLSGVILAGCAGPPAAVPGGSEAVPIAAAVFAAGRWIDLTHAFDGQTIYWPTERGFQFERGDNGPTAKG